ncbi:hypothetical protein Poly51_31980 [Rubripirellula tenax]|uniref:Methanolan biosynthesis EpsI domain-containing protein n=1 Tax=Rubripirellula tenax TaxID=2528015 RepID=A0A5C6F3V6_9BACT|nr:exosortase-associated EpsI family protein [Rubripirellula tenax]TWU54479.1 hypothetical protein Poly51_31980 [Rubripirellula tenax]
MMSTKLPTKPSEQPIDELLEMESESTMPVPSDPSVSGRGLALVVLVSLVLVSCLVHGYLDGRWAANTNLQDQGKLLEGIPSQVGQWKLSKTSELDEKASQLLRCFGSTVREYSNEATGESVNVAIMFGPRGPIAVHTPEVCYSSVGTEIVRERDIESIAVGEMKSDLWSVQFATDSSDIPSLDVWYAWSSGGPWEARENPRFWLTDNLYKIQVAGPVGSGEHRPVKEFLTEFLPAASLALK